MTLDTKPLDTLLKRKPRGRPKNSGKNQPASKPIVSHEDIKIMNLPPGTRVWLYARHSPGKSQTIEAQLAELKAVCQEKGWIIDNEFIDRGETGTSVENREEFKYLLYLAEQEPKTAEMIMIVDLSRFSRYQVDAQLYRGQLRKAGWKILSLHDNIPDDSTLAPLIEAANDWKNEQVVIDLKEKTNLGLRYVAEKGCLPGGSVVKGYDLLEITIGSYKTGDPRIGRKPEPNKTAELVRIAFKMKAQGMPYKLISKETGLYGPKATGSWNKLFRNRAYIGEYEFQGRIYTNVYPAIVSKELFDAVQKQLPKRDPKTYTLKGIPTRKHPRRFGSKFFLADIAVCKHCGGKMHGKSHGKKQEKNEEQRRYYICAQRNKNPEACPEATLINANSLESEVIRIFKEHVLTPQHLQSLLEWTNNALGGGLEELQLEFAAIKKDFLEAAQQARFMAKNFLTAKIRSDTLEDELHEQEVKRDQLGVRVTALENEISRRRIVVNPAEIEAYLEQARKMADSSEYFDKRRLVEQLCSHIIMDTEECIVELHFPIKKLDG